jgi:hypothetical protein
MKYIASAALILNLGAAGLYAHERPVKMTFSGTAGPSLVDLNISGRTNGEYNFSGNGNLGSFTFRHVEADGGPPQQSSSCSGPNLVYFTLSFGAGVLSFADGSSLVLKLREGTDCINPVDLVAHCTRIFDITSGTGRFKHATGSITMDEHLHAILLNSSGAPVFLASTGEFGGTVSGVQGDGDGDDGH